eukprot:11087382-Heterocapsa_arctica.AAC.1
MQRHTPGSWRVHESESRTDHVEALERGVEVAVGRQPSQQSDGRVGQIQLYLATRVAGELLDLLKRHALQEGLRHVRGEQHEVVLCGEQVDDPLAKSPRGAAEGGQLSGLAVLEAAD